jgi:hypothetical protein
MNGDALVETPRVILRYRRSRLLRFAAAVVGAALLGRLGWILVPAQLRLHTDIVGYPTFADFDVNRYVDGYYFIVIVFPILACAIYYALWRWGPLQGRHTHDEATTQFAVAQHQETRQGPKQSRAPSVGWAGGRAALVAATVGVEVHCALRSQATSTLLVAIAASALYVALVLGAAVGYSRHQGRASKSGDSSPGRSHQVLTHLGTFNAYGAVLTIPLLFWVSSQTEVSVTSDGSHHFYPWFPLWLLLALVLAATVVIVRLHQRTRTTGETGTAESAALVWIVGPILVFLGTASLPGAVSVSAFEGGQQVAPAYLIFWHHLLPWRDVQFIHGLLGDPLAGALGMAVFGPTNWGYTAGLSMLLGPACWVLVYAFAAYMYERDRLFLLLVGVAIVLDTFLSPVWRFLLFPLQLIVFAQMLRTRSIGWIAAFALITVIQVAIAPETAYSALALGGTLVAFDLHQHFRGESAGSPFFRTRWAVGFGAAWSVILAAFLALTGMLTAFIDYFLIVAPGHALTGGIPIAWLGSRITDFWAALPIVLVLATIWLIVARLGARRDPTVEEWVTLAAAGFVLLYYTKELGRDDVPHVLEVLWIVVPLIILWAHRLVDWIRQGPTVAAGIRAAVLTHWPRRLSGLLATSPSATIIIVLALVGLALPATVVSRLGFLAPARYVTSLNSRYHPTVASEPLSRSLGYTAPGAISEHLVSDMRKVLARYAGSNGPVFDFTNAPLLYYFLLDRLPGTRFFQVSMAQPVFAQDELIRDLRTSQPKVVIFSSSTIGLPWWDGMPNMVRHYDVSQYLLDTYHPLLSIDGELVMVRDSATKSPQLPSGLSVKPQLSEQALYSDSPACSWGFIPDFLSPGPPSPGRGAISVTPDRVAAGGTISLSGWAVNAAGREPAIRVVAVVRGTVVGSVVPATKRPDVAAALHAPGTLESGFHLTLPEDAVHGERSQLSLYALSRGDILEPLRESTAVQSADFGIPPSHVVTGPGPASYHVRPPSRTAGVLQTEVEGLANEFRIDLPSGTELSDFHWMSISYSAGVSSGTYILSDVPSPAPDQEITFASLSQQPDPLAVRVGSCLQWHGYSTPYLYLESSDRSTPDLVTLIK